MSIAQEKTGILIEPILLPNKEFKKTIIIEEKLLMEYEDNEQIIKVLKSKGIEYPITSNKKKVIETTTITGKSNEEKYSVITTFDKEESEQNGSLSKLKETSKSVDKLKGLKVYGWVIINKNVIVDSIVGLKDESIKEVVEQSMKNILNQIEYPKKVLYVGDTASTRIPMSFPAGNKIVFNIVLKTIYKLDSISNPIAYLSIDQSIEAGTEISKVDLKIEGFGKGQIKYHLTDRIFQLYQTELDMTSLTSVESLKIKMKGKTISTMMPEIVKK